MTTNVTSVMATRAVLYLRVSTGRQAEHGLSIPNQRHKRRHACATWLARGRRVRQATGEVPLRKAYLGAIITPTVRS